MIPNNLWNKFIFKSLTKLKNLIHRQSFQTIESPARTHRFKKETIYQRARLRIVSQLSSEIMQARREWSILSVEIKQANKYQSRILFLVKLSFKAEGDIISQTNKTENLLPIGCSLERRKIMWTRNSNIYQEEHQW
jgi:hypothetical protein